ncbi:MAG: tail fiber domain-containing protein, partial [Bdellovibrionia bacterium]
LTSSDVTGALAYSPVSRAGDSMTGTLSLPANGLAVGSNQLVVSGGNVGIGVATPSDALMLSGNLVVPYRAWNTGPLVSLPVYVGGTSDFTVAFWDGKRGAFFAGEVQSGSFTPNNLGYASASFGKDSRALGYASVSSGQGGTASGDRSFVAGGWGNKAIGLDSFVAGDSNEASGEDSIVAGGWGNRASAWGSFAAGESNTASGSRSFVAGGWVNTASGSGSFVAGVGNLSTGFSQFTIGQFNQTRGDENAASWVQTDPLFVIGNGLSGAARSNAMMVLKNGNVGLGTNSPTARLEVVGTISATSFSGNFSGNATTATSATTATNLAGGAGGALPYQTGVGTTTMLPIGAQSGMVLTSTGSIPQWSASLGVSSGGTGITSYTPGDLLYASGASTLSKLAIGTTSGQALIVSSGSLAWGSPESFSGSLSGDVTGTQSATSITAATVTGKLLTGFSSGAGVVSASDSILAALGKLDGNVGARVLKSGDSMTGSLLLSSTSPTLNLQAVTKQYVDEAIAGFSTGVSSFNTRTGAVSLSSSDVTSALTYTPVKKTGDTLTGSLDLDAAGSSTAAPRTLGIGTANWVAGRAARLTFGDPGTSIQTGVGYRLQIGAYYGVTINGTRLVTTAMAYGGATGTTTDASLNVITGQTNAPGLAVTPIAGQTANLQEWRNSSNAVQSSVSKDGYLGLGTSSASYRLDINQGSASFGQRIIGSGADSPVIRYENTSANASTYHVGSTNNLSGAGAGFSIYDVTGSSPRFLIQHSSGNIGIGTTAPGAKLQVNGNMILGSQSGGNDDNADYSLKSNGQLTIGANQSGSSQNGFVNLILAAGTTGSHTDSTLVLATLGAERMRVSGTGLVGIGNGNPAYLLDVGGDINTSSCFRIGATTVSGVCTSDERLKENIQDYHGGLKELLGIRLRTYQFNGLGEMPKTGETAVGVIAQEVEKTNPDLVKTRLVKMHPTDSDQSEIKVVDYSKFTFMLINAVKEIYTKITESQISQEHQLASKADQAELDRLREENRELKARMEQAEKDASAIKARLERLEKHPTKF